MLWGHAPKINLQDLNQDGDAEIIILSYHTGAHTQVWRIYERGENEKNPMIPFRSIANIGSDWGRIKILDAKANGYVIIETWNRHWEDQTFVDISQLEFRNEEYQSVRIETKKP